MHEVYAIKALEQIEELRDASCLPSGLVQVLRFASKPSSALWFSDPIRETTLDSWSSQFLLLP